MAVSLVFIVIHPFGEYFWETAMKFINYFSELHHYQYKYNQLSFKRIE